MKLSTIFFLLIAFGASAQQSFINKKGGYQIMIPEKWTTNQEDEVTIVYAPDEGEMDTWKEKLEVSLTDANDLNLEEGYNFYVQQDIPAMYDGLKIINQGEADINGLKSKWLVFSFNQGPHIFHNLFYLILKDKKFYMLQAAAEKSYYPKYEGDYLTIIRSFQFAK
jgi:hypothetical protein